MAQTIMFTDCQPPLFSTKKKISETHNTSQPKQHTPEETEQVNKHF